MGSSLFTILLHRRNTSSKIWQTKRLFMGSAFHCTWRAQNWLNPNLNPSEKFISPLCPWFLHDAWHHSKDKPVVVMLVVRKLFLNQSIGNGSSGVTRDPYLWPMTHNNFDQSCIKIKSEVIHICFTARLLYIHWQFTIANDNIKWTLYFCNLLLSNAGVDEIVLHVYIIK